MRLSLILAMAENRVIGRDNDLPWRLPADLKRFKRLTLDHTIVMGRKTFESLPKLLPRRRSIVVSRNPSYRAEGAEVAGSLDEALALADGEAEVFVIGGAALFAEALPRASRLYLTRVHAEVDGDVRCPPLDEGSWQLVEEERHDADERHAYDFTFQVFERRPETAES